MLKHELLDYAEELRKTSNEIVRLIESFDASNFDWENVTETQLAILLAILKELHPLRDFEPSLDLKQDVSLRELSKIAGVTCE